VPSPDARERSLRRTQATVQHRPAEADEHAAAWFQPWPNSPRTTPAGPRYAPRDLPAEAKKLDISGRSRMSKSELVDAIQKANAKSTRKARGK
jgi:hypothetical protein